MSGWEIIWTVVGILEGLIIGTVFSVLGMTPPEFKFARGCFWAAAVLLGVTDIMWAAQTQNPVLWRIVVGALIGATIGIGLPEGVRWVYGKEQTWLAHGKTTLLPPEKVEPTAAAPNPLLAPAGFISFLGTVIDGYAPMMQENQTETPLDDVRISVTAVLPNNPDPKTDDEWGNGTVRWQKEIEIGTCRARLTSGLAERFPVGDQKRLFFHLLILSRFQTYRETMQLTKVSEDRYQAELAFFAGDAKPVYTRSVPLLVQTIRRVSQLSQPISIDLNYDPTAKAFNFFNHGTENIYLWGDKLDDGPKSIDKPRVITPTGSYHIFADKVADEIAQKLGPNGETRVPFEVYVSTEDKRKHVINYQLWIRTKNGAVTIETQNLGAMEKEF